MLEGGVGEQVFSTRMSRAATCSDGDGSEPAPDGVRAVRRPKSKLAAAALLFWHRLRGLEVVWISGPVQHGYSPSGQAKRLRDMQTRAGLLS